MAADQRYCLNCGGRRGEPRLPFDRYLGSSDGDSALADALARASARSNEVSPLGVVLGIALLGGMLLLGVLLGRDGNDEPTTTPTVAQTATTVPGTEPSAPEPSADVVSEWPPGTDGFTVELGTLPKDGTTAADIEATKADLATKGATAVGVLDSDLYPTLPPSTYVLYSGVFKSKSEAETALDAVIGGVPEAVVIKISESGSGGKPAPSDTAAPDAGSEIPPVTESEPVPPTGSPADNPGASSEVPPATGAPSATERGSVADADRLDQAIEEAGGSGGPSEKRGVSR